MKEKYPILEFDPSRETLINPTIFVVPNQQASKTIPEHCVICFFRDVMESVPHRKDAKVIDTQVWESGRHNVFDIEHNGQRIAVLHPGVGAPHAAGRLEEAIALGCTKFIACGYAGALVPDLALGHLIVPNSAVRDEGTSYHYLPPSREAFASLHAVKTIEQVLMQQGVPFVVGKTWTTDAPYRETPAKIALRKGEGVLDS